LNLRFKYNFVIVSKLSRAYDSVLTTLNYLNEIDNLKFKLDINEDWIEFNNKKNEVNGCIVDLHGGNWIYPQESKSEFVTRIQKSFEDLKKYGSVDEPHQTLIFTHSQVISTILSHCMYSNSNQLELYFHLSNGSITCLDITEDNSIHVQTINYTKHLSNPTGHHTLFV
jgi:broad specificity phosphatase PhoE